MRMETCDDSPPDWPVRSIESVSTWITSGGTPSRKRADYYSDESGVPWVKTQELQDRVLRGTEEHLSLTGLAESSAKLLPQGTVLMAMYAAPTAGRLAILSREMACNQAACAIVPDPSLVESRWLFYQLLANRPNIHRLANGAAQQNLAAALIRSMELPIPPLPVQRAIAGVLGALDDKIESNRRLARMAEELCRAEFRRALLDHDFERFEVALDVVMGAPFAGASFSEPGTGRPLIRIRDLKTHTPQVWTTEERPDEVLISPGDVVVGMDADFRSTIWLGEKALLNQRLCCFRPRSGVATAFAWLAIEEDLRFYEGAKSGTTVIHLNKSDIEQFRVPALSSDEHASFRSVTEPLVSRMVATGRENASLTSLRDALLPELLSGRIRVRDAEKFLEDEL